MVKSANKTITTLLLCVVLCALLLPVYVGAADGDYTGIYHENSEIKEELTTDGIRAEWSDIDGGGVMASDLSIYYSSSNYRATFNSLSVSVPDDAYYRMEFTADVNVNRDSTDVLRDHAKTVAGGYVVGINPRTDDVLKNNTWPFSGSKPVAKADYVMVEDTSNYNVTRATKNFTADGIRGETVYLFTATYPDNYLISSPNNYVIFRDVKFTKLYNDVTVSSGANGEVMAMDWEGKTNTVAAGGTSVLKNLRGEDMTLYAFPADGYVFDHWEDADGNNVSDNGALTVTTGSSGEDATAYNYKAVFRAKTEDDVNLAEYIWADCEENLIALSDIVILSNVNDQFVPYEKSGNTGIATEHYMTHISNTLRGPSFFDEYSLTFCVDIPETENGAYIVFDESFKYHRGYDHYEILVDNKQEYVYRQNNAGNGYGGNSLGNMGTTNTYMIFGPYEAGIHTVTIRSLLFGMTGDYEREGKTTHGIFLDELKVISEDTYRPTLTLPQEDTPAKITGIRVTRQAKDGVYSYPECSIDAVRNGTFAFQYNDKITISYEDTADMGRYMFSDVNFSDPSTESTKSHYRNNGNSVSFYLRGDTDVEFIYDELTDAEISQMILKDTTQKAPDGTDWDWTVSNAASIIGLTDANYSDRGVKLANKGDWISVDLTIPEEKGDQFIYFYARWGHFIVTVSDGDGTELARCDITIDDLQNASYYPTSVIALAPGSYTVKIETTSSYGSGTFGNFCTVPYDEAIIGTIDLSATAALSAGGTEDATVAFKAAANLPEFLFFSDTNVKDGNTRVPVYIPVYVSPALADKVTVATGSYTLALDPDKIAAYIPKELVGGKRTESNGGADIKVNYTDNGFAITPLMISREEDDTKGTYVLEISADKKEDVGISLTLSVSDSGGDGALTYGEAPVLTLMQGDTDVTAQAMISYSADGGTTYKVLSELLGDSGVLDAGTYYVKAEYSTDTKYGAATETFEVKPASLTVSMDASAVEKVYDATTDIVGDKPVLTLSGAYGDEQPVIDAGSVTFAYEDKNVGTGKTVTATNISLSDAAINKNYTLVSNTAEDSTAVITAKEILITGLSADNKEYDGRTDATVLGTAVLDGNLDGENLTLTLGSANFSDKNAADNKTVTFSGYMLDGSAKDNYTLKAQPVAVTASINPREVNVTVSGDGAYTYNGKADYTHTADYNTVVGETADVTVLYDGATEKPVNVKYDNGVKAYAITVTINDSNYKLKDTSGTTSFTIEQAPISVASVTVSDKIYDTTADATVTEVVFDGLYEELLRDTDYTVSAAFRDANVGDEAIADVTVTLTDNPNTRNYKWESDDADKNTDVAKISKWGISGTLAVTLVTDNNGDGVADIGDVLKITGVAPASATVDWTWSFDGAEAVSGTDSLTITEDNLGNTIVVTATGTGNYDASISTASYRIGARTLSGTISIDGTTALGETLTATLISASGQPMINRDYRVEWHRVNTDDTTEKIEGATSLTYTLTEADIGRTVRVMLISDFGATSVFTGTLSSDAVIPPTVAVAPVIQTSASYRAITVSWKTPFDGGSDITGYTLTVTDEGGNAVDGSPISIEADATSYKLSGLTIGTEYTIVLTVTNAVGSTASAAVTDRPHNSATVSYVITFDTNGAGAIAKQFVLRNSTATKPADPVKDGFTFAGWYTDKECNAAYDFGTMVTKDITLYAKWTENNPGASDPCDGTAADNCPSLAFTDLDTTQWYHASVDYVLNKGMMNGTGDGIFAPNGNLSRAMLVTILWRLEGKPVVNYAMTFDDVAADVWYTEAVRWAASEGIVEGYNAESFGPNDDITREQLATILYRYEQYKGGGFVGAWMFRMDYVDLAEVSDWAYEAMCWMTMNGVVNGRPGKVLDPKGTATRAEAAAMLNRYCELAKDE